MFGCKIQFHKAFTLAELMVILAVMTIIIAAIAPILTSRHNTLMSADVWHEVSADNNGDIYTDGNNHLVLSEIMIGLSPIDLNDIKNNYHPHTINNYAPYAKMIVRSSDRVKTDTGGNVIQKPIEFYHSGARQGYLLAGRGNLMIVGDYGSFNYDVADGGAADDSDASRGNTAFGRNALNSISSGGGNTAVGANALSGVSSGMYNTAIGSGAGASNGTGNVFIGYKASASGNYNTIISNDTNNPVASRTTAIGENIIFAGDDNVVLGYSANGQGSRNTAVGSNSVANGTANTAIGANSCKNLASGASNKTCIGLAGTSEISGSDPEVHIGRGVSDFSSPSAVVVRSDGEDSAVIVYGNLIVRGQTYMRGRSPYPSIAAPSDALLGYSLYMEYPGNHKPFYGFDGSGPSLFITRDGYQHQAFGGKENCICTDSRGLYGSGYANAGLQSYEWTADYSFQNQFGSPSGGFGYYYNGDDSGADVELNMAHAIFEYGGTQVTSSCCPILTQSTRRGRISDARLKNIGEKYTSGLEKVLKLKAFNYTFKSDKFKISQVGVIAQDLKTIFPDAVKKNADGYYKVRWDEMFYSAINSVKELNAKIVALVSRVQDDIDRIVKLKKDNKKLEDKILKLAEEIEKLEQGK